MRKAFFSCSITVVLALAFAGPSLATIIPVEDAVEAVSLRVRLSDDLTGKVGGRSCETCELKEFPITPQTRAFENNQQVDLRRLRDWYGKPATIIYNIRSGEATRILWFR